MATPEERLAEIEAKLGASDNEWSKVPVNAEGIPSITVYKNAPTSDTPQPGNSPNTPMSPDMKMQEIERKLQEGQLPSQDQATATDSYKQPQDDISSVANFLRGAHDELARGLALPADKFNALLVNMGLGIIPASETFGDMNKKLFESVGIRTEPIEGMSAKYGRSIVDAIPELALTLMAAPGLAAVKGMGALDLIRRSVGEMIQKNPGLASAANLFSAAGSTFGKSVAGDKTIEPIDGMKIPLEPYGEIAGAVGGGMIAAPATAIAKMPLKLAGKMARGVAEAVVPEGSLIRDMNMPGSPSFMGLKPSPGNTPAPLEPLRPTNFNIAETNLKQFSEDQLTAAQDSLNKEVVQVLEGIQMRGPSKDISKLVNTGLEKMMATGRRIEHDFWERVDQSVITPTVDLKATARAIEAETAVATSASPQKYLEKISKLNIPGKDPETGRFMSNKATVEHLRELQRQIQMDVRRLSGAPVRGEGVNGPLVRNHERLYAALDKAIGDANPGDVSLQQARAFSTKFNDMFKRGSIGDVLRNYGSGENVVPEGLTLQKLLESYEGLTELLAMRNTMAYTRQPGVNKFALSSGERAEVKELLQNTEDGIRSMFREAADAVGKLTDDPFKQANASAKWFASHERYIKQFAKLCTELETTTRDILDVTARNAELKKSALARFVQYSPDKAIMNIWNDPNPAKRAGDVVKHLTDPDARYAFRTGLIDQFWNATGMDPINAFKVLNTPRFADVLRDQLTGDEWSRLQKMVNGAASIAQRELGDSGFKRALKSPFSGTGAISGLASGGSAAAATYVFLEGIAPGTSVAAAMTGAAVGRHIAHMTGGGSVQMPGIMAKSFKDAAGRALRTTNPQKLLAYAIQDTGWEKTLSARLSNPQELRDATRRMRRMISYGIAGKDVLNNGDDND